MEQRARQSVTTPDVVIVGGGIGGGALAKNLAEAGVAVLVLERTQEYADVVRGEWIAPWGVPETKAVGVYPIYRANGGHHVTRHVSYGGHRSARRREAAFDVTTLLPDNPGPLCIGHPTMCNLLNQAATSAGATILRGVSNTRRAGSPPTVTFDHAGKTTTLRPRLVVAADGRHGKTAEQIGAKLQRMNRTIGSRACWSTTRPSGATTQFIATEGDVNVLAFPQGGGRIRLYIGFGLEQKTRFAGAQGPQRFLDAFPEVRAGTGAHRGRSADRPVPGVPEQRYVDRRALCGRRGLIGDAAGRNGRSPARACRSRTATCASCATS
jgi:2-polyprenyl-6-methoxyphenol hydroxylase-like FAD-dependent oxidoreductase